MNESADAPSGEPRINMREWKTVVAEYEVPSVLRASWQLVNTFGTYILLWVAMYWSVKVSWWLTAALAVLAGGLLVRVFIIFHDCGHRSFFKSRRANDIVGFIAGVLTFTPYYHWRWEHSLHHGSSSNLDRRGTGDIWTMTVQEYLEASKWKRFAYRLARNPFVLFALAPLFLFLVRQRFASLRASPRERHSVWWMNLALAAWVSAMCWIFGWQAYLLIQLSVTAIGGAVGVWLFYVQHQFEDAYWERNGEWDYVTAALQGSSFYKLPKVLQWFSGNIGFHHIHHLSPRVPNYNLERCQNSNPLLRAVKPVGLFSSFRALAFRLWDEHERKLVGFRHIRKMHRQ